MPTLSEPDQISILALMLHDLSAHPRPPRVPCVADEVRLLCSLFLADLEKVDPQRAEYYRLLLNGAPHLKLAAG